MSDKKYFVMVPVSYRGSPGIFEEYLVAIRHDQYRTGDRNTYDTSPEFDDAFIFKTLAAAEFAAVFVGGDARDFDAEIPERDYGDR